MYIYAITRGGSGAMNSFWVGDPASVHVEQVVGNSGAEKMAFCCRYRGGYMRNRCAYRER